MARFFAVILVKNLILLYERILRFIIFDNTVYSLFNYLVTVMAIFVTKFIYNYRAHNYLITIVMKFRNYFPSSTDKQWLSNLMFDCVILSFFDIGERFTKWFVKFYKSIFKQFKCFSIELIDYIYIYSYIYTRIYVDIYGSFKN